MQDPHPVDDAGKDESDICGIPGIANLSLACVIDGGKFCCGLRSAGTAAEVQQASKFGRPPPPFKPADPRQQESNDHADHIDESGVVHQKPPSADNKARRNCCSDSPTLVKVLTDHLEHDLNHRELTSETLLESNEFEISSLPLSECTADDSSDSGRSHFSFPDVGSFSKSLIPVTDSAIHDAVDSGAVSPCICKDAPCSCADASNNRQADDPSAKCMKKGDAASSFNLVDHQNPAPLGSNHQIRPTKGLTRWHRGVLWLRNWLRQRASSVKTASSPNQVLLQGQELSLTRDFRPGDTIGFGSYGRVFTARHCLSGQIVAVKEMLVTADSNGGCAQERIKREVRLCQQLAHLRIVHYLGHEFVQDKDGKQGRLFLFMEYCCGGSIATHLRTYGPLELCLVKKYMGQLLEGLCYLHSRCPIVVHRDLKCANLLLTHDASLKIADFGSSKWLRMGDDNLPHGTDHSVAGTLLWMAPEVLRRRSHVTTAVDVWSTGCCLLEMVTANVPWAECCFDNIFEAYRKIVESDDLPSVPPESPAVVCNFVEVCLQRDPSQRPKASELQNHPLLG